MPSHSLTPSSSEANYSNARRLIQHVTATTPEGKLAFNAAINPHWLDAKTFWYERETSQGKEFRLVDSAEASGNAAFDHQALADALSSSAQKKIDVNNLPITQVEIDVSPLLVTFVAFDRRWTFDGDRCTDRGKITLPARERESRSPDGRYCVFVRDHNLWLRSFNYDGEEGVEERPLTDDGEEHYAYGAVPNMVAAGQDLGALGGLQVTWSPDSKRLFALQLDMRQVKSLPVVHHVPEDGSVRPRLEEYKYPMPGDTHMPEYRLIVIDIENGEIIPADYPPICFAFIVPFFTDQRGWWATDSQRAYFVDLKRGGQHVQIVEFNTVTGERECYLKKLLLPGLI